MTKYRTQSATVLNDADALERRMDWILFAQEQDARLWGNSEEWLPGDPLFTHPWLIPTSGCDCCPAEEESEYTGHTVRPIFQVFEVDDTLNSYIPARCEPCGVSWHGDEVCFVCDAERKSPYFQRSMPPMYYGVNTVSFSAMFDGFTEGMRLAGESIARLDIQLTEALFEGFHGWATLGGLGPYSIVDDGVFVLPTPSTARVVACDEVDGLFNVENLFQPADTTLSMRRGVRIPPGLDLSPTRELELPVLNRPSRISMPEQNYMNTPITRQRRRR